MNRDLWLERLKERARVAYDEDREPLAVELLSAYLRHRPDDAYAWFLYGDSLRIVGRGADAHKALLMAEKHATADQLPSIHARLGMLCKDQGRHAEAEQWFDKATDSDEGRKSSWIWILRGSNLAVVEEFERALDCYRRAAVLEGDREEAYYNLGLVLTAQGKYLEASKALERALQLVPEYPEARAALKSLKGVAEAIQLAKHVPG